MSLEQINQFQITKINKLLRKLNKLKKNIKNNDKLNIQLIDNFVDFNNDIDMLIDDCDNLSIIITGNTSLTNKNNMIMYNHYTDLSQKMYPFILYYELFLNKKNYNFINCSHCNIKFTGIDFLDQYSKHLKLNH